MLLWINGKMKVIDANRCYRYTFFLAKWKEKWAQKMQNHLLAKLLSKICSHLGFSFQNSIEYLPLWWLESIHWTQRENKAIYKVRGHSLCFLHILCDILSMCLSWFDRQDRHLGSHRDTLSLAAVFLFCQQKKIIP